MKTTKPVGDSDGIRKLNKARRHWLRRLRKGGSAVAQDRYGIEMAVKVLRQRKGVVVAEVVLTADQQSLNRGIRATLRFVNGRARGPGSQLRWYLLYPPGGSLMFAANALRAKPKGPPPGAGSA